MRPIVGDNPGMRTIVSIAAALVLTGAGAGAAAAQSTQAQPVGSARLQGSFLLAGRVTVARNVRGEYAGQNVSRTWRFTPLCPSGQCQTVVLVRQRAAGSDTMTLERRAAGHYSGQGSFTAPLICDGRTYPKGERIPFTIAVTIDAAIVQNDVLVAGRVSATYANLRRINNTPCVAALGHDAAGYHGHLLLPPSS
jgi:hypothetical protein